MSQDGEVQYWKKRFAAQPASGLTKAAYCKKNQIAILTSYAWTKKINQQPKPKNPPMP